jgi:hypothetical protein
MYAFDPYGMIREHRRRRARNRVIVFALCWSFALVLFVCALNAVINQIGKP